MLGVIFNKKKLNLHLWLRCAVLLPDRLASLRSSCGGEIPGQSVDVCVGAAGCSEWSSSVGRELTSPLPSSGQLSKRGVQFCLVLSLMLLVRENFGLGNKSLKSVRVRVPLLALYQSAVYWVAWTLAQHLNNLEDQQVNQYGEAVMKPGSSCWKLPFKA